jgi:hypothetical protein
MSNSASTNYATAKTIIQRIMKTAGNFLTLGWRKRGRMTFKPSERSIILTFRWWNWAKLTKHFRNAVAHEAEVQAECTVYIKHKCWTFYDLRFAFSHFRSFSITICKICLCICLDISKLLKHSATNTENCGWKLKTVSDTAWKLTHVWALIWSVK